MQGMKNYLGECFFTLFLVIDMVDIQYGSALNL